MFKYFNSLIIIIFFNPTNSKGILFTAKGTLQITKNSKEEESSQNLDADNKNFKMVETNFTQLIQYCKFYGKFSNGVSLFINKIMCFTILVDSFNMNIVDHINLIDPYYLIAIVFGCSGFICLTSLDIISVKRTAQYFIHRIRISVAPKYREAKYEPPIAEISLDLVKVIFLQQGIVLFLPVRKFIIFEGVKEFYFSIFIFVILDIKKL